MSYSSNYTTLIFDIGDVLFSWSADTKTSISPKTLRRILSSLAWNDYERGRISQDECYARVGIDFSIDPAEVAHAFELARNTLQSNEKIISVIRDLKALSNGALQVFAMSNISAPDYEFLRKKPVDWSIFDHVFTSAAMGERKPNLAFYKAVLSSTRADPSRTIFVDDKMENVLSARSLGMCGIIFDDQLKVTRALYNLLGDPVKRGREYLTSNAKKLQSVTDNGVILSENFSQLLIFEATHDRNLVNLADDCRIWNFFQGKPSLTTDEYPYDFDTTALGLTVMNSPEDVAHSVMDEMLTYSNDDGIIQTYFDHSRPRFDPVVCINTLTLFYSYGRGHQLDRTLHWVRDVLFHRAYLNGTRYYATPEAFLYFLGRLLEISNDAYLAGYLKPLLIERIQERIGSQGDALALSMRICLCAYLGLRNDVDLRALLPLQCEDGGWEIGWIYRYPTSDISVGTRGLTTSLAVKAILDLQGLSPAPQAPPSPSPPYQVPAVPFSFPKRAPPPHHRHHHRHHSTTQSPPKRILHYKSESLQSFTALFQPSRFWQRRSSLKVAV